MTPSAAAGAGPAAPAMPKQSHLPSLDGLRGISIALVVLGHLSGTRGFPVVQLGVGDFAHFGVVVFFVISGFLITRLLLAEQAKTGTVSLKNFYIRRALRLFPAMYVFLACVWVLDRAGAITVPGHHFWWAATYTANYLPDRAWEIGHLWSLSVEEQFYLLWPFVFVVAGPRRLPWVAAAAMAMGPVARLAVWVFLRHTPYRDLELFPVVADSIAAGCFLAAHSGWLEAQPWYTRMFAPGYSLGVLAVVLALNRYLGYSIVSVFGTSVIHVGIAFLVHRSVCCWQDGMGRMLNSRVLSRVGVLSYSIYLWQQLFLNRTSTAWTAAFPQNLLLAVAVALASYEFLEKPLLKLRQRLRNEPAEKPARA